MSKAIRAMVIFLINDNYLFPCFLSENIKDINDNIIMYCERYNINKDSLIIGNLESANSHLFTINMELVRDHFIDMMKNIDTLDELHKVCEDFGNLYCNKHKWTIDIKNTN